MNSLKLTKNLFTQLLKLRKDVPSFGKGPFDVLLTTPKVIDDVCKHHLPKTIIVDSESIHSIQDRFSSLSNTHIYQASSMQLRQLSGFDDTKLVVQVSTPSPVDFNNHTFKSLVLIDQVSDPGNLGTLIRTSLAFGIDGMFLVENSCNPFNEKVIRGSSGASFFMPLSVGSREFISQVLTRTKSTVLVASSSPQCDMTLRDVKLGSNPYCIVLGNESRGSDLSKFLIPKSQVLKVHIPIKNIESLNVSIAGSIMMHHLQNL